MTHCREHRRSGAEEWVQNGIPHEAEHANQPLGELERIGRRMIACGGPGEAGPDLLEPFLMIGVANDAENPRGYRRAAIAAGLSLHEDEFDVVLDDGIRLVGLAEELSRHFRGLVDRVGNLVPDDRGKIVESKLRQCS